MDEAELRLWKQHMTFEVLVEFAVTPMKRDDVRLAVRRLGRVHTATFEDVQRVKTKLTTRREASTRRAP